MKMENYLKKVILKKTNQTFEQTLKNLNPKDQQALTSLNTYFYWKDFLNKTFPLDNKVIILLDEATFDLVSSLFNSFSGFYRQGMISLRSSLELTELYVYYFDHPVEFKYFLHDRKKRPLPSELINKENFLTKKYCLLFVDKNKLKKELHTEIEKTYKELSFYVHGRLGKLQTLNTFPVNFNKRAFSNFLKEWQRIIFLGNTILAVRFYKKINIMDKTKRDRICSEIKKLNILEV